MKRIWTKRFETAVVIVIGLALFIYYVKPNHIEKCQELIEIINTAYKHKALTSFAKNFASQKKIDTIYNTKSGLLMLNELKNQNLYNRDLLPIHEGVIKVAMYGKNIDYNDLIKSEIESILIGYGFRKFIMIDVNKSGKFDDGLPIFKDNEIKARVDNLIVVCRSNNFND